jgi:TonB family protein
MWFIEFNIVFAIAVLLFNLLLYKKGNIYWNRWLLLLLPIFFGLLSFLKPSIGSNDQIAVITYPVIELTGQSSEANTSLNWIVITYVSGIIISLLISFWGLFMILKKQKSSKLIKKEGRFLVYSSSINASFFNLIFIDEHIEEREDRELILLHEKAHSEGLHSLDRLFTSLIQSILWFNPVVYLWKSSIAQNHEFLADKSVLFNKKHDNYSRFLLRQQFNIKTELNTPFPLASNMSNLKSRIMKMNEKTSRSKFAYLIIPVFALLTVGFASSSKERIEEKTVQQQIEEDPIEDPDVNPEYVGGDEAMLNYLAKNIKYPESALKDSVGGKVFVSLVINKKGAVNAVNVLRGPREDLNNEAVRVISKMPDWVPGEKSGKKVDVKIVIPINFKVQ